MSDRYDHSEKTQFSGSPTPGEPEFLAVGKLLRPHGVQGELHFAIWTDFPERLVNGTQVFVGKTYEPMKVEHLRGHESNPIISFVEINNREDCAPLRNQVVYVRTNDLPPLPDGEIYLHQMIGLRVVRDDDNALLGRVIEILETGANDVLIVRRGNGPDILIPDIDSVVLKVDLEKEEIRVRLLPGLLPED